MRSSRWISRIFSVASLPQMEPPVGALQGGLTALEWVLGCGIRRVE